jgi:hypothetical protein
MQKRRGVSAGSYPLPWDLHTSCFHFHAIYGTSSPCPPLLDRVAMGPVSPPQGQEGSRWTFSSSSIRLVTSSVSASV